ncbi:MAG: hypothetical protein RJB01_1299 [Actinomycetota bacterium]|jgi:hypothetical protein
MRDELARANIGLMGPGCCRPAAVHVGGITRAWFGRVVDNPGRGYINASRRLAEPFGAKIRVVTSRSAGWKRPRSHLGGWALR